MKDNPGVSLVIPVFNESKSVNSLVETINSQSLSPSEILLVDGASTDDTVQRLKTLVGNDPRFRIIEAGRAMPGKGRNIGAAAAMHEWIAFTDGGIRLDKQWLENMVAKAAEDTGAGIVYGNYSPEVNNFFEKCATIAYVAPAQPGRIRGKFIASSMFKKEAWTKAGGFPDFRAAEDLIFMEKAEQAGYRPAFAPAAMISWQLRPDLASTYKRFALYSKYNVWAGRQAYWHYGVARQYIVMLVFVLLAIFHSWYWILALPVFIGARTINRVWMHRYQFGWQQLFNPAVLFTVALITLLIDAATFAGWIKAGLTNKDQISTA